MDGGQAARIGPVFEDARLGTTFEREFVGASRVPTPKPAQTDECRQGQATHCAWVC